MCAGASPVEGTKICASAATVDNAALEAVVCEFESHLAYHALLAQPVEATVSKAVQSQFESEREYQMPRCWNWYTSKT